MGGNIANGNAIISVVTYQMMSARPGQILAGTTQPPTHRPAVGRAAPTAPHQTFALTSATGQREYDEIGQRSPIFSPADREMH